MRLGSHIPVSSVLRLFPLNKRWLTVSIIAVPMVTARLQWLHVWSSVHLVNDCQRALLYRGYAVSYFDTYIHKHDAVSVNRKENRNCFHYYATFSPQSGECIVLHHQELARNNCPKSFGTFLSVWSCPRCLHNISVESGIICKACLFPFLTVTHLWRSYNCLKSSTSDKWMNSLRKKSYIFWLLSCVYWLNCFALFDQMIQLYQ